MRGHRTLNCHIGFHLVAKGAEVINWLRPSFPESTGSSNKKEATLFSLESVAVEENLWQGQILGHFCEILGHVGDMLGYVLGNFMSFWVQY